MLCPPGVDLPRFHFLFLSKFWIRTISHPTNTSIQSVTQKHSQKCTHTFLEPEPRRQHSILKTVLSLWTPLVDRGTALSHTVKPWFLICTKWTPEGIFGWPLTRIRQIHCRKLRIKCMNLKGFIHFVYCSLVCMFSRLEFLRLFLSICCWHDRGMNRTLPPALPETILTLLKAHSHRGDEWANELPLCSYLYGNSSTQFGTNS